MSEELKRALETIMKLPPTPCRPDTPASGEREGELGAFTIYRDADKHVLDAGYGCTYTEASRALLKAKYENPSERIVLDWRSPAPSREG